MRSFDVSQIMKTSLTRNPIGQWQVQSFTFYILFTDMGIQVE